MKFFGNSVSTFENDEGYQDGTVFSLIDSGVPLEHRMDVIVGWVSVLMTLKASVDFGIDLRFHDADL